MSRATTQSRRKNIDIQFLKTLPGIFLLLQLVCCTLGFILGMFSSHFAYYKSSGHVFFLLVTFVACFTTILWILVHFCEVKTSRLLKGLDWNKMGMIHSGVHAFFVMVGSACMIDLAAYSSALKAAGVFGFLGFATFLVHLSWEVTRFLESTLPPEAVVRAVVSKGPEEVDSLSLNGSDGNDFRESAIMGTTYTPRPQSTVILKIKNDEVPAKSSKTQSKSVNNVDSDSFDSDDSANYNKTNEGTKYNFNQD